jgi:hypothetical protein
MNHKFLLSVPNILLQQNISSQFLFRCRLCFGLSARSHARPRDWDPTVRIKVPTRSLFCVYVLPGTRSEELCSDLFPTSHHWYCLRGLERARHTCSPFLTIRSISPAIRDAGRRFVSADWFLAEGAASSRRWPLPPAGKASSRRRSILERARAGEASSRRWLLRRVDGRFPALYGYMPTQPAKSASSSVTSTVR